MLWIPIILGAAVLVWAVSIFNRLVGLRNRAQGSWSDIDVQLKRRHDLIPNLVETVKGYAKHERTRSKTSSRLAARRCRLAAAAPPLKARLNKPSPEHWGA